MAPRKPARGHQEEPRRSARLLAANARAHLLSPLDDPEAHTRKSKSKTKQAPKQKKPRRLECTSCARTLNRSSFPDAVTQKCDHDVTICKACTKAWISTQLDNTTYDRISCPECPQLLASADVQANATRAVYDRYDELERRGIADSTPGWRWCLAPHCRAGQVHQPLLDTTPKVPGLFGRQVSGKKPRPDDICTCNECGAKACVPCDRPFHEGETCDQLQKRLQQFVDDDKATQKTIKAVCKQCPKCNRNIQRQGGCDFMNCTQCGTAFCWICMLTYSVISKSGHGPECMYTKPGRIDPHAPHLQNNGAGGNNGGGNNLHPAWMNNLFAFDG